MNKITKIKAITKSVGTQTERLSSGEYLLLIKECVENSKNDSISVLEEKKGRLRRYIFLCGKSNLLSKVIKVNGAPTTPPLLCEGVHFKLLKEMIKLNADVLHCDFNYGTVLHLSTHRNHLSRREYHQLVELIPPAKLKKLLQFRDRYGRTPLSLLLKSKNPLPETLSKFLECGADFNAVDWTGNSVLANAILGLRGPATIQRVVNCGGRIHWKSRWMGRNLLHFAADGGNPEIIILLIDEYRFDPNEKDRKGWTPLDYSMARLANPRKVMWSWDFNTAYELQKRDGKVNKVGICSLINVAAKFADSERIELLLLMGFGNVDEVDLNGNTPLQNVLLYGKQGSFETAKLLLEEGADPYCLNKEGENLCQIAMKNPHLEIGTLHLIRSPKIVNPDNHLTRIDVANTMMYLNQRQTDLEDEEFKMVLEEYWNTAESLNFEDEEVRFF